MTLASLPARHRQGVARCEATTGVRVTDYGLEPLQCHAVRGLRWHEGLPYCAAPGHREQVVAKARRQDERCRCGSRANADGLCQNADCGNWCGPE